MIHPTAFIHETAIIDEGAQISAGVKIWHFCHIMSGAVIGEGTSIGQSCFIGSNVIIGKNCKIQNFVNICDGVEIKGNVYIGSMVSFVNVKFPRAFRKGKLERTKVESNVSIGSNSSIVCGIVLGESCQIGIGSVVTKDIPSAAVAFGNPAVTKKNKGYHP